MAMLKLRDYKTSTGDIFHIYIDQSGRFFSFDNDFPPSEAEQNRHHANFVGDKLDHVTEELEKATKVAKVAVAIPYYYIQQGFVKSAIARGFNAKTGGIAVTLSNGSKESVEKYMTAYAPLSQNEVDQVNNYYKIIGDAEAAIRKILEPNKISLRDKVKAAIDAAMGKE